jgi:hypothetical protein
MVFSLVNSVDGYLSSRDNSVDGGLIRYGT